MKRTILVVTIATLLSVPALAQRYGQLETDILYTHIAYEEALIKGDVEKLRGFYAIEYIQTNTMGDLVEEEDVLEEFSSGRLRIETLQRDYERTRGYGETGIVNVVWSLTGKRNGAPFKTKQRVSVFYVKRGDRWVIVAEQMTPIKVEPDPPGLEESLIDLERAAWEAWKIRNEKFFDNYLVAAAEVTGSKVAVFKDTTCAVKAYTLDNFTMKTYGDGKATLSYKARQDLVCKGKPVSSTVLAATLFVKHGDRWLATFHDESPTK